MNSKFSVKCSHCPKILKNPVNLPCKCETICAEHLKDPSILKAMLIKCNKCNKEFFLNQCEFESNKSLEAILSSEDHLSDTEKKLKVSLQESIANFFHLYEQFEENKSVSLAQNYSHFQEIRRKLDLQREEIKEQIDKVFFSILDQSKEIEASYKSNLERICYNGYFESQNDENRKLEETFRDINLSIDSLKHMQLQQDAAVIDMESMLNELKIVNVFLTRANDFEPNLTFDRRSFGLVDLNPLSKSPFNSTILVSHFYIDFIKLCQFSFDDKWSLLYRGSRDGFSQDDFHTRCDFKSPTLTICKAKESGYIFGGYTEVAWILSESGLPDPNAFLFSLTNKDKKPLKMNIDPSKASESIFWSLDEGPIFGHANYGPINDCGHSLFISNDSNVEDCYSELGGCFKHPQYAVGTIEANSFLAGAEKFQLSEIEVYEKK